MCICGDVCLCVCEDGLMSVRFVSVPIIEAAYVSFQSLEEIVLYVMPSNSCFHL